MREQLTKEGKERGNPVLTAEDNSTSPNTKSRKKRNLLRSETVARKQGWGALTRTRKEKEQIIFSRRGPTGRVGR